MAAAVLDKERGLPAGVGVELDAAGAVLVADEVDVVVIGRVGDLEPVDNEAGNALAEPVEDLIDGPPVRSAAVQLPSGNDGRLVSSSIAGPAIVARGTA